MIDSDYEKIKLRVKRELADFLGVDMEDIDDDSVLSVDLHMKPTDLTDFTQLLTSAGFDTASLDLTEIETFEELVEALVARE